MTPKEVISSQDLPGYSFLLIGQDGSVDNAPPVSWVQVDRARVFGLRDPLLEEGNILFVWEDDLVL